MTLYLDVNGHSVRLCFKECITEIAIRTTDEGIEADVPDDWDITAGELRDRIHVALASREG